MRSTKQLSAALAKIEIEAINRIKLYFKNKNYSRIQVLSSQHLNIQTGMQRATVEEINADGSVIGTVIMTGQHKPQRILYQPQDLPADALLTILDELERMKKGKQLMKP